MSTKTGLVFFPAFDWAISPTHPEREERLLYTKDQLFEEGIMDLPQILEFKPRIALAKDVARTHFCIPSVEEQTLDAHLIAAGGALILADELMQGNIKNGFALVRPPGHHAMKIVHGNRGFCNINNEAIMVEYLRQKYNVKKIVIVDTDVHHGDGTQDIFYHDPNVLFISFHQDGRTLYPGTGFIHEMGGPKACAKTINIPLPPETGDAGIHYVMDNLVLPIISDFKPDLVINSAGQDNHYSDPLANMNFTAQGYAKLTEKLKPDLAVLEGGYAIETALPYVNMAIILAMAGVDYSNIKEPDYSNFKTKKLSTLDPIKKLVSEIGELWTKRKEVDTEKFYDNKGFFRRHKNIFYDTSYIQEEQVELVKKCYNCNGYITYETFSDTSWGKKGAYCVSIPLDACSQCQDEGILLYEQGKSVAEQEFIYLQDKSADVYKAFSRSLTKEIVLE